MDVLAGVTQEEGNTEFSIHLLSAVLALIFLARRIQPFLSLVDREVEFCVRHRSSRSQRNLGKGKSAPQNPQQLQGRGEIAPMERLAKRNSEGNGQLEATRRLQTGQHLQRPKGGEDHHLVLRLQAEGRRTIQGRTRRSRPRPRTWDRLREELCTSVQHRKHTDPARHSMRARMTCVADGCGGGISAVPHRQGRLRGASTGT